MAALAEAAADTVSSEVGQATGRGAYMITDFRDAPIGTNGAISVEGTLAGWSPLHRVVGKRRRRIGGLALDTGCRTGRNQRHVPRQRHGRDLGKRRQRATTVPNFVSTVFAADLALIVTMVTAAVMGPLMYLHGPGVPLVSH